MKGWLVKQPKVRLDESARFRAKASNQDLVRSARPFALGTLLLVTSCRLGYDASLAHAPEDIARAGTVGTAGTAGTGIAQGGGGKAVVAAAGNGGSGTTARAVASAGSSARSCENGLLDPDESAVDCGGRACPPCPCRYATPTLLSNPNYDGNRLWGPSLTGDGLTIYFGAEIVGASERLAFAERTSTNTDFGLGQLVPAPVGQGTEGTPFVLPDNLTLYFYSTRAGSRDLYVSRRASTTEPFAFVQPLTEVNTDGTEHLPWVSADQLTLYFTRTPKNQSNADIWRATRASVDVSFDPAEPVTELNSSSAEDRVVLSADQRVAILGSQRGGSLMQLYEAARASTAEPFGAPRLIVELVADGSDYNPALTSNGDALYFTSTRGGSNFQLWYAARTCP